MEVDLKGEDDQGLVRSHVGALLGDLHPGLDHKASQRPYKADSFEENKLWTR